MSKHEVKRTMAHLAALLNTRFSEEERVPAKDMQKGYKLLRDKMRAHGRLLVTSHGNPEAVMLPFNDTKLLFEMLTELMEQAENSKLLELATERLTNQRTERIPLEQGLEEIRKSMLGPSRA